MSLLNQIIKNKQVEIAKQRKLVSIAALCESPFFEAETRSFSKAIKNGNGVIAEFKRKSPSEGAFSKGNTIESVMNTYKSEGVAAVSILTDAYYFGGNVADLLTAKSLINVPVLRKDFIVDEYQLFEAKANGADAVLLIAEALDEYHTKSLATIANSIGLEVLMEFHSAEQLHKLNDNVDVIGINNRDLKTLNSDIRTAFDLINRLPFDGVKIAESAINSQYEIEELLKIGYDGFLIGTSILKDPTKLASFIKAGKHFKNVPHAS